VPSTRELASQFLKPELAKDCPDNLYGFVERLIHLNGELLVDNEPFTWVGHEYLIEPYKSLKLDGHEKEEGDSHAWMCGAQVGKSIAAMLFEILLALWFWGKYIGYFLPDKDMSMIFSANRFKPMCLNIPQIADLWGEDPTGDDDGKSKKNSDQKRVRSIGPSLIFFSYMAGKTSTESIPMLAVLFDEVRRMLDGDIERALERMSHSPYPIDFKISTAGYPDVNIDKAFKDSKQNRFHSACKCRDGIILADRFPECVGERGALPAHRFLPKYFWICPKCKEPILNPRDGQWVAASPNARADGWHIPQILSPRQTAEKIFLAFLRASDITEFYNSKLGIAHLSKDAQIVDRDTLRSTVNTDLRWLKTGVNCAMGVDQMFGFNCVVIRYRGPKDEATGLFKSRLAHVEWILSDNPWERTGELMEQFDVSCCVVDSMPNSNEALRFSKDFRGRVFLADYSYQAEKGEDICIWGDKVQNDPNKKASDETKQKYRVRISRYHAILWNLMRYVNRLKEQPHERGLIMPVPNKRNEMEPTFICENVFWDHLCRVARRKEMIDEAQGKFKMVFENVGLDPHFLHSDLYAELALSRLPDPERVAFAEHAAAARAGREKDAHVWMQAEGTPNAYVCKECLLMVRVKKGQTPQDVAASKGFSLCLPNSQ